MNLVSPVYTGAYTHVMPIAKSPWRFQKDKKKPNEIFSGFESKLFGTACNSYTGSILYIKQSELQHARYK